VAKEPQLYRCTAVANQRVLIKDGEHSLWRPDMRLSLYTRLEAFLAANLAPR